MIVKVYSVYDTKAKGYLQPFHATNAAVACRMIADAVAEPNHMFNKHAPDYILFEIGDFDDDSGTFNNHSQPTNLGNLVTFLPDQPLLKGVQ